MNPAIDHLIRALGYRFEDPAHLEQALTHRSAGGLNNERLEFLGDAILGFVIADELFRRFVKAPEGQMSRLRASLVKRETLADIARDYKLGDYLKLGPGELRSGGQARSSILADALEAVFAAVYLDGGYEQACGLIRKIFKPRLDQLDLKAHQKDPKTRLQELLQSRKIELPDYEIIDVSGDPHDQLFTVRCLVNELELEQIGRGSSRRRAEQAAAKRILQELENG